MAAEGGEQTGLARELRGDLSASGHCVHSERQGTPASCAQLAVLGEQSEMSTWRTVSIKASG